MRIGLISDIHANLAALDAVLGAMPEIDLLACCGDIVGYYAEPNEVCDELRARNALCVRGNHDAYVLGALEPNAARRAAYRTDWTRQRLRKDNLEWLAALPVERRIDLDRATIILRHASPWDEETYLYADSPRLQDIELEESEILAVGHTHRPILHRAGRGLLVNPGSVGQPRDWNPLASYALLGLPSKAVDFKRVPYDVRSVQSALTERGWEPDTINILGRRQ
jgi:putative phosphoesterase